jgi:hypothetical protein
MNKGVHLTPHEPRDVRGLTSPDPVLVLARLQLVQSLVLTFAKTYLNRSRLVLDWTAGPPQ